MSSLRSLLRRAASVGLAMGSSCTSAPSNSPPPVPSSPPDAGLDLSRCTRTDECADGVGFPGACGACGSHFYRGSLEDCGLWTGDLTFTPPAKPDPERMHLLSREVCDRFCEPLSPELLARNQFRYCWGGVPRTDADGGAIEPRVVIVCSPCPSGGVPGRRPANLPALPLSPAGELASYFRRACWFEAASIDAFRILANELSAHGAPDSLVRAARRAMRDECLHARLMGALARRFGGEPEIVPPIDHACRELEAIAIENAVEGCVGETHAAAVAIFQCHRAGDRRVRAAMRRVAEDESRHAQLAWSVHAWAMNQVGEAARRRVREAMRDAGERLGRTARGESSRVVRDLAGEPDGAAARALIGVLSPSWNT